MAEDKSKIPVSRIAVDTTPVIGSNRLITSDAVATAVEQVKEQAKAKTDADGNDIRKTYARISDVIFYEEMD